MAFPTRILCGTDGSERAEEAARQAAVLAAATASTLVAVHAIDPGEPHGDDVEAAAEAALARVASIAERAGARCERRVAAGDAATVLVDEAERHGCDLVAIGADGGALAAALRVGRVALSVLRAAPMPTLVARGGGESFPGRVLAAVDGSAASAATAARGAALAAATGSSLRILHVVPVFRGGDAEWVLSEDEASPAGLAEAVRAATAEGVRPVREMAMGRPEHAILSVAEREGVGLLVVGHHGRSGFQRAVLGSVSEHVARHARSSVLVVRGA